MLVELSSKALHDSHLALALENCGLWMFTVYRPKTYQILFVDEKDLLVKCPSLFHYASDLPASLDNSHHQDDMRHV